MRAKLKFFEWLLPKLWRTWPEPNAGRNDATLGRVTDTDPVYRALLDHAHELLEDAVQDLIAPEPKGNREYLAGRVQGLACYIARVESYRERAREMQREEGRR